MTMQNSKFFKVLYQSKERGSKARLGEITTDYGKIKTPAFVPVATKGTLKALSPNFVSEIGVQVAFVNTYHLVTHPGVEVIKKAGGIHKFANLNIPLMSDSGGFQVSLWPETKRKC
jgi:queuine tRNA-ribosyltransferase